MDLHKAMKSVKLCTKDLKLAEDHLFSTSIKQRPTRMTSLQMLPPTTQERLALLLVMELNGLRLLEIGRNW